MTMSGNLDEILTHQINKSSIQIPTISNSVLLSLYKTMIKIRCMEIELSKLTKHDQIRGFCHLCIGQEGIYSALQYILQDDKVITSYRCHGLAFATGCTVKEIAGELLGKRTGCSKGKGGSMHLYNSHFYGGHGIVGAQVPLGLGISFALKYLDSSKVCFTFYGDGAANQGQVWESFNMAAIWKLPIVFVCENNEYGMWTPARDASASTEFYKRGITIPGICVDDSNIVNLIAVLKFAREHAMKTGPIIVQVQTYRLCRHSTNDVKDLRMRCELQERDKKDCLKALERVLEDASSIKDSIAKEVEAEIKEAQADDFNDVRELFTDILL